MEKMPYRDTLQLETVEMAAAPAVSSDWQDRLPVLSAGNVVLRELRESDAESLFALLTTEEVTRFISPPPDTVAGRIFGEWLAAYNRGAEREVEEFIGARFSPDFLAQLPVSALVAFHLQSRAATGELTATEIEPAGEHALDALAGGAAGAMTISLEVEPEPPHRITRLRLVPPES